MDSLRETLGERGETGSRRAGGMQAWEDDTGMPGSGQALTWAPGCHVLITVPPMVNLGGGVVRANLGARAPLRVCEFQSAHGARCTHRQDGE